MFLLNKDWKLWLRYGQGPCLKSLIEHGFIYPFKLAIYTAIHLNMVFLSMLMNVVINNDMVI